MSKLPTHKYKKGDIVSYTHYLEGNDNHMRPKSRTCTELGYDWIIVSYKAKILSYDCVIGNNWYSESCCKLIIHSKLKGMKRLNDRFYGWYVSIKSLKTGRYLNILESDIHGISKSDIAENERIKMNRKENIKSLLS